MVELELLQSSERTVPLLHELEPPTLERARFVEQVALGFRLAQERPRDEYNREQCEPGSERQRKRHAGAAA